MYFNSDRRVEQFEKKKLFAWCPFFWCIFYFNLVSVFFYFFPTIEMSVIRTLTLLTIGATIALAQRRLALPDPRSCANRKYWQLIIEKKTYIILFYC